MIKRKLFALLLLVPTLLYADAEQALNSFLTEVTTLRADFSQEVVRPGGEASQRSGGRFLLSRPGRFRWDYLTPYRQEIVSDGSRLWFYDTDLEQITVKPLEEGLGSTPALLLTGSERLDERFRVTPLSGSGGIDWVELVPLTESNFSSIRLAFQQQRLHTMEVIDGLGQITRIHFTAVERNPQLDQGLFDFTPPPGVDLLGDPG